MSITLNEVKRREKGLKIIKDKIETDGIDSLIDLTGLAGGFDITPEDISLLETYAGPAVYEQKVQELGIKHLGGEKILPVNRTTSGIVAMIIALVKPGTKIVHFLAKKPAHPSIPRTAKLVGADYEEYTNLDEFKIDGVRIDAADSIDFSFFKKLRNHINYKKEDLWLMGEVIHGDYSRWANDEMLHTTTNYECYKGLYSSHNDRNYFEIAHSFRRQFEKGGIYEKLCLYNFVDNHDVNRLASVIKNPEHIYNIYTLLYTMPGIPSIYYGSEYGIKAIKGKNTDLPLRPELNIDTLKDGNKKLFKLICDLGEIRSKSQAIRHGTYSPIIIRNEQFVFLRKFKEQEIYVALNLDDKNVDINYNFSFHKAIDLLSGKEISIDGNISIEPYGALIISKDNSI